jgi:hypothetical protein
MKSTCKNIITLKSFPQITEPKKKKKKKKKKAGNRKKEKEKKMKGGSDAQLLAKQKLHKISHYVDIDTITQQFVLHQRGQGWGQLELRRKMKKVGDLS